MAEKARIVQKYSVIAILSFETDGLSHRQSCNCILETVYGRDVVTTNHWWEVLLNNTFISDVNVNGRYRAQVADVDVSCCL